MATGLQPLDPDRFQDVRSIGAGNNATVFSAWDRDLERRVALKVSVEDTLLDMLGNEHLTALGIADGLRQFIDEIGDTSRRRYTLLREAKLLARVQHPNVISVLDVGVLDGSVTVVMPLLPGGHLDDKALPGPWRQLLDLALDIGEGLAALHEAKILHRDFKPNNILLDHRGQAKIADLGLACVWEDEAAMTDWAGTTAYMAPETRARAHRDRRDDIYAYCTVVFQMFHGHMPFASEAARLEGRVSRIERHDQLPPALLEALARGLHPDADSRWPDMPALLSALRRAAKPARGRRWWPGLTAGVAAGLAAGVLSSSSPVWADACEGVADELAAVWDADTEIELRGALNSRAGANALGSWSARWLAVRAQECKAAQRGVRRRGPSPCSGQLREHFAATVAVLQTPHMRDGLDYAAVISALPPPEQCLDRPNQSLEDRGEEAPGLLELRERDRELELLLLAGDDETARERVTEYMAFARVHGARYDMARAMLWRGELLRRSGALDEADLQLTHAYERAAAIGADLLGVDALLKLMAIAGAQGHNDAVDAYARVAKGVLTRERPERVAELMQVHGLALLSGPPIVDDRIRAVELLRAAVTMREEQYARYGGSREGISQASEALARGWLGVRAQEQALAAAQQSLAMHRESFSDSTVRAHALLRLVFAAQVTLGRLDDAELTERMLLDPQMAAADHESAADECEWIASIYLEAGERGRAEESLTKAGRLATSFAPAGP